MDSVPSRIMDEIIRTSGPTLIFDLAVIAANMQRVAEAARAVGIKTLFAAKSFPDPRVRALAAELLDGFDVASPGELRAVDTKQIISVVDPSGATIAGAHGGRLIVGCETIEQVRAAPARAEIAIRVSASITGRDPAVGAVLEGTGHRRSRFGLADREAIAALAREANGRPIGLHVHHGPVVATSAERFIATARAALELADFAPAFLDLGGAWSGIPDLAAALAELRGAIPSSIEIIIEPGRLFADRAGFACGHVQVARTSADRELRVVDLSRICHLKWSLVDLIARAPHPGEGKPLLFVGPTCYEDDVIGEWIVSPVHFPETAQLTLCNVSGYALAWNTSFGGVPPADVVMIR